MSDEFVEEYPLGKKGKYKRPDSNRSHKELRRDNGKEDTE